MDAPFGSIHFFNTVAQARTTLIENEEKSSDSSARQ
jgi:hypothetical protein